jgi:hypothetical protein
MRWPAMFAAWSCRTLINKFSDAGGRKIHLQSCPIRRATCGYRAAFRSEICEFFPMNSCSM